MKKILINAYAVSPGMGSEPGLGWNWCVRLAHSCELFIITEGEFRDRIETALKELPQAGNMHFFYNPVSDRVRRMCWNQGDWRFYFHYRSWQKKALGIAREICRSHPIDLIHHLNMIGFREPGFLWRISGVPYVHGPINCKFEYPLAYWEGAPAGERIRIRLKDLISRFQMRHSPRFRRAVRRADAVITASSDSRYLLKKYLGVDSLMMNETGCDDRISVHPFSEKEGLDVLWVGRLSLYSKLPDLALKAVACTGNPRIRIHFVGAGEQSGLQELSRSLGIEQACRWYGSVSHEEVLGMMERADVLLLTSVIEGTPHVVLEAMANGLPVVCFDTCGQGDIVDDSTGIKIPLTGPEDSTRRFAEVLNLLESEPEIRQRLSEGCARRLPALSWSTKIGQVTDLYEKLLSHP
jgi:glycosyltransferase involved in cell wall biosynthesis